MSRGNPFPDYPVAVLGGERRGEEPELTIRTAGIRAAQRLVEDYVDRFPGADVRGTNALVRGEFGTGKTHLLEFAGRFLRERGESRGLTVATASVGAMEATPVEWYRTSLGARIGGDRMEGLGIELLADVAKVAAGRAPLTTAAAARIESDPQSASALISSELLNPTAVEVVLIKRLGQIVPGVGAEVKEAIKGVAWGFAPALRWLEGEALSDREMAASRLPRALDSDDLVADAIVVTAALHVTLGHPFLLAVDELEHLVRYDEVAGGKRNVTWFKRLLERLERVGALVLVAGCPSAWDGHPDFLDRFSGRARITLEPLSGEQVLEIVERYAEGPGSLTVADGWLLAEAAEGNIRRTLSALNRLYEASDAFTEPISSTEIEAASADVDRGADVEKAIGQIERVLAAPGLRVLRQTAVAGIPFDLVAFEEDRPRVVVEIKHALFGMKQQEQAQGFVEKVRVLNERSLGCIGVFASESPLDSALQELDPSAARILWLDLTQPGFTADLERALARLPRTPDGPDEDASERQDAALADLTEAIQGVKDSQAEIYERLEKRLSEPGSADLEFRPHQAAETHDPLRTVYEDLAQRPSLTYRLGLIRGRQLVQLALWMLLGIVALASGFALESSSPETTDNVRAVLFILGPTLLFASLILVAFQLMAIDRYYTFKRDRLRDLYVREAPANAMIETNLIFDEALQQWGVQIGRRRAVEALRERGLFFEGGLRFEGRAEWGER